MTADHVEEVSPPERPVSMRETAALAERLLDRIARSATPEAVFGAPFTAYGRTVIPVSRTYFALGSGGGQGEGKTGETRPSGRGTGGGAGSGGAGYTVASGYIELSAEGTRYIAITSNRDRLFGALAGLLFGLTLARLLRR